MTNPLLLVVVLLLSTTVCAFVPPRPGTPEAENYESVYAYRQRLGIQYDYTPKLISDEMCRFITPEECRKADENFQAHATAHKETQAVLYEQRLRHMRKQRQLRGEGDNTEDHSTTTSTTTDFDDFQEQLGAFTKAYANPYGKPPPTLEEELEELNALLKEFNSSREEFHADRKRRKLQGPSVRSDASFNPSVGSFTVPLLLMKFTDHASRPLPEKYHYQILWNLRIRKWIDENSYGKYTAFFDVQEWEMTDNSEDYYSFGQAGRTSDFQTSFYPLLNNMDARLGGDWSLYDANGDGYLDNLIVIHSGYAAEEGGEDCTNGRARENRIWSHAFADTRAEWKSANGQYMVRGYNIASALDLKCGSEPGKMGVMTHEYMHTFFLIDLYDTSFVGKGVGNFDIMAYPYGHGNDGYIPVNLSPWAKETVEWQTCTTITTTGTYTIEPAAFSDNCYKIYLVQSPFCDEYIMLENRQQANFDIAFWKPGLVMYHIDDCAADQRYVGYPGIDPDWPTDGDHYRVTVIQKDGKYDLEQNNNMGDSGDIFGPGDYLGPNTDGDTFPNTDSYQDGYVFQTGIEIKVLDGQGRNVVVEVTMPAQPVSRPDDFLALAPEKQTRPPDEWVVDIAEEQFVDPLHPDVNRKDQTISGLLPQMPWWDEYQEEITNEATKTFTSNNNGNSAASATSSSSSSFSSHSTTQFFLTAVTTTIVLIQILSTSATTKTTMGGTIQ